MFFNNPQIIKSSADSRIGGVDVDESTIDFDNYMLAIKFRILGLICDFVDDQIEYGMTKQEAQMEAMGQIYNYLHWDDKDFDSSEMALAEQIMNSKEFIDWRVKIYYRFQDMHYINVASPIEVSIGRNEEEEKVMKEEENMFTILEGLVAQYK